MEEAEVREKILKGAESLFSRFGVRSVSMDDIARHLSVSKKTLYAHFKDKDDLVVTMAQNHLEGDRCAFADISSGSKNSIDELYQMSMTIKKDMEETNPSMLFDLQKFHPKAWQIWLDFKQDFIKPSIVRCIERGIAEGNFRPELNPEIMAINRLVLIEATFNPDVFPKDKFNMVEVTTQFFDHFIQGLCTEQGLKVFKQYK
jgi:AcrR family transcriptional regulator